MLHYRLNKFKNMEQQNIKDEISKNELEDEKLQKIHRNIDANKLFCLSIKKQMKVLVLLGNILYLDHVVH